MIVHFNKFLQLTYKSLATISKVFLFLFRRWIYPFLKYQQFNKSLKALKSLLTLRYYLFIENFRKSLIRKASSHIYLCNIKMFINFKYSNVDHSECLYYNKKIMDQNNIDYNSCEIFGLAGILIQIILATSSFMVLVYKRYHQTPKRPWKIWILDTSKQGVSQMLAHFINIFISLGLSKKLQTCACNWYFSTNILDNTLGVFLCIGSLQLLEKYVFVNNLQRFQSGNYYYSLDEFDEQKSSSFYSGTNEPTIQPHPLQISIKKRRYVICYTDWLVQLLVWNAIVLIIKTLLFYIEYWMSDALIAISDFILGWVEPFQAVQLILVIIIVPVIMNGFAFWIQDNFLKKKGTFNAKPQTLL